MQTLGWKKLGNSEVTAAVDARAIVRSEKSQAFVIWLDPAAPDEAPPSYQGRIEHLASSTRERFTGSQELLAFIERAIAGAASNEAAVVSPPAEDG